MEHMNSTSNSTDVNKTAVGNQATPDGYGVLCIGFGFYCVGWGIMCI